MRVDGFALEPALEQTREALAVAGFVLRHLVDGVVDGIVAQFLGELGQIELALAGAGLSLGAELEVLLGAGGDHLAEQLSELGGVLRLFPGVALVSLGDLGIAIALGLTGHRQIHADLGALTHEVVAQTLNDALIETLGGADDVLAGHLRQRELSLGGSISGRCSSLRRFFDLHELVLRSLALGALGRSLIALVNITANGATEFHVFSLSCDAFAAPGW